jgi:opacity protein-like surface antigen
MNRFLVLIAVLALLGLAVVPASAGERDWHVRVFASGFDPDLDVMVPAENPDEIRVTADSDLGFGASLELQLSELLGLELGVMQASPSIELSADVPGYGPLSLTDSLSTLVITLDLDVHLTPGSEWFDVYLGGGVANVGYGDLHYVDPDGDPLDLETDDDLTYSIKAGVDIALGSSSRWAATGCLRYLWSDLEVTQAQEPGGGTETFDFDIFHFSVGIAYTF